MRLIDADELLTEVENAKDLLASTKGSIRIHVHSAPTIQAIPEVEVRDEVKKAYQQGYMDGALYGMAGVKGGHDE